MRTFGLILTLFAAPAQAWTFTPDPVCTLADDTADLRLAITYDPWQDQPYAIALTLTGQVWPQAHTFAIRFPGSRDLVISTDRHQLSDGGRTLTVTDRGFDNVLNGLAQAGVAVAQLGERSYAIPLGGISAPLAAFLACPARPIS